MLNALIMAGATVGLYVLMRAISREQSVGTAMPVTPPHASATLETPHPEPVVLPVASRHYGRSELEVRGYYFAQCDAAAGPVDIEDFFDEITLDIFDPRSGGAWQPSFHVATPKGIACKLRAENWDYISAADLIIVPRFNIQNILEALMEHVEQQYELEPDTPEIPPVA